MVSVRQALDADAAAWGREHLVSDVVGWLTTLAPDGRLQASVVSFLWDADSATVFFYSRPDAPKVRNIAAHPAVSLHLNSDPYGDHVLVLEGTAAIDPTIPPGDVHAAYRAKYRAPLEHWGMGEAATAADFSVPIRITPSRVRAW